MKRIIATLSIVSSMAMVSYSKDLSFKPSYVTRIDRSVIISNLTESDVLDPSLLKYLQNDSVSFLRVYNVVFNADDYTFDKIALSSLWSNHELIWCFVHTKMGDSIIATCEVVDGKYVGLQPASNWERGEFSKASKWLGKKNVSLSDGTLIHIQMQDNWHLLSNQEIYVLDSCKRVKFSTFYKRKYGTIEAFRKSFIFEGQ